jgi:serine/threonine-protein kinase
MQGDETEGSMNILGKEINGYLFQEALGSGSFGAVYKVLKENKYFAAKVLSETYVLEEFKSSDNRIGREIEVLKRAKGAYLISYIEEFVFTNEFGINEYVIVMEYFDGITLKEYLKGEQEIDELVEIFEKVLQGVAQLHNTLIDNEGIIHRDLKPANIMISDEGDIRIIDYGLTKVIDFSSLTSTGAQIGSPLYMSPEQIRDSKRIDYRADIYSLGIILYQMLTKEIPYKATTIPELMLKILNEPVIPPKQFNPNISDGLENIIYKATAKDTYARFGSIHEFIDSFKVEEIEAELFVEPRYYAWVYREKTVTMSFNEQMRHPMIYPIHVMKWQKGLHNFVKEDSFENVIVDPSTQRLSYLAFGGTKGLTQLPYAPDKGVISLDYLKDGKNRSDYINKWYNHVKDAEKLILPYHYISNTDYSVDKIDDWIKINIQIIDECSKVVDESKKKYAMISIGLSHLVFQSEKILSYFTHADVDYFVVQVSDMKQMNEQSLASYLDFMEKLQSYSHKPVIALKVPISLGLTLLAMGIHGFSLGLASIDYFNEDYIKEEKDSFNMYSKYYFPQLMSFLTYPKKDAFAFEPIFNYFGGCTCKWCDGKNAIDIATGDMNIQLHFWESMKSETEQIASLDKDERMIYIKSRISEAIKEFKNIPKTIMRSQTGNDYYKLLVNLDKVI